MDFKFLCIDIQNPEHQKGVLYLLDAYMRDEMGMNAPMPKDLAPRIIDGLKAHEAYIAFIVLADGKYAALANCNKNFSTFKAKPLINIHDFVVHPDFRGNGVGKFLLDSIASFCKENDYCRINLEVRDDNVKAQNLYKKCGFEDCNPPMYFWEKNL